MQSDGSLDVATRTRHVRAGEKTRVRGKDAPGRFVRLQTRVGGRWSTLERARARNSGRFILRARPDRPMSAKARVLSGGRTEKVGRLNVYRSALASWYGPGLYGNPLACGGTLQYGTIGVAHKYLPCGTRLTVKNGKREVRVRVIDRGPFSGAREYDLTEATARKLNFSGVGTVLTTR
jgi:rare lipoprotein A